MANILLVEDDVNINRINMKALDMKGHNAISATSAAKCLKILKNEKIDLIVLDVGLPDKNGIELCEIIKTNYDIPVLFLTAMGEKSDVIEGFNVGADDYISKPYDLDVFIARINARLKNSNLVKTELIVGGLKLDSVRNLAYFNDRDLLLTKKEFALLWILADNFCNTINKEIINKSVWGNTTLNDDNAIWTVVSRLKGKLKKADTGLTIASERLKGYKLDYLKKYE